ncbi:unnamed protein product [Lampetra fluviatilis]
MGGSTRQLLPEGTQQIGAIATTASSVPLAPEQADRLIGAVRLPMLWRLALRRSHDEFSGCDAAGRSAQGELPACAAKRRTSCRATRREHTRRGACLAARDWRRAPVSREVTVALTSSRFYSAQNFLGIHVVPKDHAETSRELNPQTLASLASLARCNFYDIKPRETPRLHNHSNGGTAHTLAGPHAGRAPAAGSWPLHK